MTPGSLSSRTTSVCEGSTSHAGSFVDPFSKSVVKHDKPDEKATTYTFIIPYHPIFVLLAYPWRRLQMEGAGTHPARSPQESLHKSNSICKWGDPIFVTSMPRVRPVDSIGSRCGPRMNFRARLDVTSRVSMDWGLVVNVAFVWWQIYRTHGWNPKIQHT